MNKVSKKDLVEHDHALAITQYLISLNYVMKLADNLSTYVTAFFLLHVAMTHRNPRPDFPS